MKNKLGEFEWEIFSADKWLVLKRNGEILYDGKYLSNPDALIIALIKRSK